VLYGMLKKAARPCFHAYTLLEEMAHNVR